MTAQKTAFSKMAAIGAAIVIAYQIASVRNAQLLCNLLSAATAGLAAVLLTYCFCRSPHKASTGKALLLFALASFSWCVADVLWTVSALLGGDPENSFVIGCFYSGTNLFLGGAVLLFLFYQFSKWNSIHLLLDTLVVGILSLMLAWIVFFNKTNFLRDLIRQDGLISVFCIAIDLFMLIGFLIVVYSIRKGKIQIYILLFGFGIAMFSVSDLNYYYKYTHDAYIPNSLVDVLYVASLVLIALAGLWRTLVEPEGSNITAKEFKIGHRWLILFLFPLGALLAEGFVLEDASHLISAIIMYKVFSNQVQLAAQKDELYRRELDMNRVLEQRIAEQYSELVYAANHDTVTKLYNRRFFMQTLEDAIKECAPQQTLAVFMIDLDRFKAINDTLGHEVGDKVLIELSARMHACSQEKGILSRLGGDEFALLFPESNSNLELQKRAEEILACCSVPIGVGADAVNMSISIGIALFPKDAKERIELMRAADIAMYRAKEQGRNRYAFYGRC